MSKYGGYLVGRRYYHIVERPAPKGSSFVQAAMQRQSVRIVELPFDCVHNLDFLMIGVNLNLRTRARDSSAGCLLCGLREVGES